MVSTLIELLFYKGLSIKRWSNYPRLEDISIIDNLGSSIHTALLLAQIESDVEKKEIDRVYIIKKMIFSSFKKFILSDINSGTNSYISKINPEIKKALDNKVESFILSLDNGEYIKDDIENILGEERETEDKIIMAARNYIALKECENNAKLFPQVYEHTLGALNQQIAVQKEELTSLKQLMSQPNLQSFLSQIMRLSHAKRWLGKNRKYEISVMEHLVIVTFISYIIGSIENDNGNSLDMQELLLRGMYHDIPEAITGDIISPTKGLVPGFREVLEEAESQMLEEQLFIYLPERYNAEMKEYILSPFSSIEGKYVKHADIFSMVFESAIEVDSLGSHFIGIRDDMISKAQKFSCPSSEYILKNCVKGFGTTDLDSLMQK